MTRKGKYADERRRARGDAKAMNAFNITATNRLGAMEIEPGEWRLTEERRVNGQWEFYRYMTEIETFPSLVDASVFAIEEAKRQRDAIRASITKADWVTMYYPAAFLSDVPRGLLPGKLPPGWEIRRVSVYDKAREQDLTMDQFYRAEDGLRVSMRYKVLTDGKEWCAVNASYADETPDWETMSEVKILFLGAHRWAFQVHPPRAQYVSYSNTMLHWFCPLNGWNLPDLRGIM